MRVTFCKCASSLGENVHNISCTANTQKLPRGDFKMQLCMERGKEIKILQNAVFRDPAYTYRTSIEENA